MNFPLRIWTSVHSYPVRTKLGLLPLRDILAERPEAGGGWHKLPQCWSWRGGDWRLYPNPSSPPAAWLPPVGRPCLQPAGGAWGQKHNIGWGACDHHLESQVAGEELIERSKNFFFVKPRTTLLKMKRLDPIANERKHYNFKGEEFAYRDLHTWCVSMNA